VHLLAPACRRPFLPLRWVNHTLKTIVDYIGYCDVTAAAAASMMDDDGGEGADNEEEKTKVWQ